MARRGPPGAACNLFKVCKRYLGPTTGSGAPCVVALLGLGAALAGFGGSGVGFCVGGVVGAFSKLRLSSSVGMYSDDAETVCACGKSSKSCDQSSLVFVALMLACTIARLKAIF